MVCQKRFVNYFFLLVLTVAASGCATHRTTPITILAEGSVSLTRTAPQVTIDTQAVYAGLEATKADVTTMAVPMLGLVPGSVPAVLTPRLEPSGTWLSIDNKTHTLAVIDSGVVLFSAPFSGNLPEASTESLSVLLKQRNAVWFAPDQYFSARALSIPAANSRDRYLKGALGDFVIYLSEDFALYSGPVEVPEINGMRVEPNDLARLYYLLPVGSKALENLPFNS